MADYDKLLRVCDNLMRNAINYASNNSTIEVKAYYEGGYVVITFTNQSEQMNEEALKHLFDKFYSQEVSRTTISGGAGLGLAIAKAIVESHDGSIHASLQNQKITFTIKLKGEKNE